MCPSVEASKLVSAVTSKLLALIAVVKLFAVILSLVAAVKFVPSLKVTVWPDASVIEILLLPAPKAEKSTRTTAAAGRDIKPGYISGLGSNGHMLNNDIGYGL